ncbi:MAG: hypothetical protein JWO42_446 [Chloroflexi bacterium]|nr:hypothetical protein [Chloroflexota bacterium]
MDRDLHQSERLVPAHGEIGPQALTIMTTEHYNLQSARSATISESNGRASLFMGTVSSTLVALGFIGQVSRLTEAFYVFSLVLLPTLLFLGLVTFERVLQSAIEAGIYARGINRIRHLYVEMAPNLKDYFILSTSDDTGGLMQNMGLRRLRWQEYLSTAGTIAVINSIVAGVLVALVVSLLITKLAPHLSITQSLPLELGIGGAVFLVSLNTLQRYQRTEWLRSDQNLKALFPSDVAGAR